VTEGPTLLPRHGEDKRTKEVFALSLERMNPRLRRGFAPAMNRLDEPTINTTDNDQASARHCYMPRNSACPESLFFPDAPALILCGLSRQTASKHKVRDRVVGNRFLMDRSVFRSLAPVFTDVDL